MPNESSMYVPLDYIMNPEYEDLIYGDQLRNGMIVLIESSLIRENPDKLSSDNPYDRLRVRETSRWCEVTNLRRSSYNPDIIHFIGLYGDGTKTERTYNISYTWYVKKESMIDV